ncbi:hypothetical protein BS47DRAFT_87210 [Hydnum rufescens UP504]|uniref:Uncharacterized protein n=1 Tax=Hydnum rufescens UP504 TaxID=1448309 RepID=A0A9P6BAI5_9AGAM|nr:hypothetical protein BS47DRAFT_87210 [Hydnum rufescens UP504]
MRHPTMKILWMMMVALPSPSRVLALPEECVSPALTSTRDISPPAFVTLKTERHEQCQLLSSVTCDDVTAPVPPIMNEDGPKSFSPPIEVIPDNGPKTNKLDPSAKSRPKVSSSPPSNAATSSSTVRRSGPTATEVTKRKRQRRVSDVENIDHGNSPVSGGAAGSPLSSTASVLLSDKPSTVPSATLMPATTPVEKTPEAGMKKTNSGTAKRARKVKEQSSPSTEAPSEATASSQPSSPADDPCVGLDLPSLLVDALVFGRVSFLSAPDLVKSLVRDQPHLLERQGVEAWTNLAREVLAKHKFFGKIARHGKGADGNKLEDAWYYESSFDPDRGRAETLAELAPPSSRRRKAKMGDRTYFYEPVDMNRWVVAAEEE